MNSLTIAPGRFRWTICMMVFFATTINYLDRAVISLLKPQLETEFNWTETDYSNIVIAFQLAYAIGLLLAGKVIDKIGTRIGYAVSIVTWSVAAMGHALVKSTLGFGVARAFLGFTEAGNFPAAIKTVAEWFPKKERAFATGILNSGANVGAIVAPLTVPFIAAMYGWQWAFIATGAIGFVWLIFWLLIYDIPARNKRLSKTEYDYIHSDVEDQKAESLEVGMRAPSWRKIVMYRQAWAFILGKFLTDPIWWFYLFWLPAFLNSQYKLEPTAVSLPVALIYTMSTFGSVIGGWLPMYFTRKNKTVFASRKRSMLIYAFFAVPVLFAQYLGAMNMWLAVLIIGIGAAGHQAWSANMYTIVSDLFPKKAVASVIGIGGMAGALGGLLIAKLAGLLFDHFKSLGHIETGYYIMFLLCGSAYLIAWLIMHFLVPSFKIVEKV